MLPPCVGVGWLSRCGAGARALVNRGTSRKGKTIAEIRSVSTNMCPAFWVYSWEEARAWPPPQRRAALPRLSSRRSKAMLEARRTPARGGEEGWWGGRDHPGRGQPGRAACPGTRQRARTAALRPGAGGDGAEQPSQTREKVLVQVRAVWPDPLQALLCAPANPLPAAPGKRTLQDVGAGH